MTLEFSEPITQIDDAVHHAQAAEANAAIAAEAVGALRDAVNGDANISRILLRAAAGAGKSFVLKKLVSEAIEMRDVARVAVIAFQNKQIHSLAHDLGEALGRDTVCLLVANGLDAKVPDATKNLIPVVTAIKDIPTSTKVVVSTAHKLGARGQDFDAVLGAGALGDAPFDVLFVDEAWQMPQHVFVNVEKKAPIWVGVGDVGQLAPIEVGVNPWRGDAGYNPYRAWPTRYEDGTDPQTWVRDLPSVWRPTSAQLGLWRAFYSDWDELNCVAGPGDRSVELGEMSGASKAVWSQVASGVPTLLEIDGLPDPDAPDVDLPLMGAIESLLDDLFASGFSLVETKFDDNGSTTDEAISRSVGHDGSDSLVTILATRNQAVDDAIDAVERLAARHSLGPNDLNASTVDSWQGKTNGITVAIHPLSGADALDDFNSEFGRLAVASTRATHGLLMVSRPGLDELLRAAPARPGTPIGEPGFRTLPRQTHQRILMSYARGTLTWTASTN